MYYECAYTMHVLIHYINWLLLCWTMGYTSPKTWSGAQFAVGEGNFATQNDNTIKYVKFKKNTKQLQISLIPIVWFFNEYHTNWSKIPIKSIPISCLIPTMSGHLEFVRIKSLKIDENSESSGQETQQVPHDMNKDPGIKAVKKSWIHKNWGLGSDT